MSIEDLPGKPGQRSYGERVVVSARPPVPQKALWQQEADKLGITLGSWVILKIDEALGQEIPDFVQEELDRAAARRSQPELEELHMRRAS